MECLLIQKLSLNFGLCLESLFAKTCIRTKRRGYMAEIQFLPPLRAAIDQHLKAFCATCLVAVIRSSPSVVNPA